jgi:hypothetical protein
MMVRSNNMKEPIRIRWIQMMIMTLSYSDENLQCLFMIDIEDGQILKCASGRTKQANDCKCLEIARRHEVVSWTPLARIPAIMINLDATN